jgi:hypothetical protein
MSFKSVEFRNVSVAVWSGEPTLQDCDLALHAAQQCYENNGNHPVILVCVLKPGVKLPAEEVRQRMVSHWTKIVPLASAVQYISLPTGRPAARLVSMLVTVFALARNGKRIVVHRSLRTALAEVQKLDPGLPMDELEKVIRTAAGMEAP